MNPATVDQVASSNVTAWTIISGILGILAFIISAINFVHYYLSRRANLEITVLSYDWLDYIGDKERIKVEYRIINKSDLPVSIAEIYLLTSDDRIPTDKQYHTLAVYRYLDKETVIDRKPTYNRMTPINLSGLASDSGTFVFVAPLNTRVNFRNGMYFEIVTSRLKVVKVKLEPKVPLLLTRHTLPESDYKTDHHSDGDNSSALFPE